MVRLPLIIRPMVWSSRALATASAAMLPPAPTLLSTITGWPRALDRGSAKRRAGRAGGGGGGGTGGKADDDLGGRVRPCRGGCPLGPPAGCARQCDEPQPGMTANEAGHGVSLNLRGRNGAWPGQGPREATLCRRIRLGKLRRI